MLRRRLVTIAAACVLACSGCDDDCVAVDTSCTPLYEPTFDNVYTNTLAVSCAVGNGTCHTADGASVAGGMAFDSADEAYAALAGSAERVVAGDAACSLLVARVEATGSDGMPPGSPLAEAERCAIVRWVANGAAR